jgi:3-hydroxybutyryl-CoA dehydrogenase
MDVNDIKQIAVVGAGYLGHSIAQEFAVAGYQVSLNSRTEQSLARSRSNIAANLDRLVDIGSLTRERAQSALPRIRASTALQEVVEDADVVIEAVFEDLEVKQEVFRSLDQLCPERTILASTTSSLLPSQLASATGRPGKVVAAHYFPPTDVVRLVEIMGSEATTEETVATLYQLLVKTGKTPIIVRKETPGFIYNRLATALCREALSIVQRGIANPEDVDMVLKSRLGRTLVTVGLFELLDLAGWDVLGSVFGNLLPEIDSSSDMLKLVQEKVARNELGVKSGRGFYQWTDESVQDLRHRIASTFIETEKWAKR